MPWQLNRLVTQNWVDGWDDPRLMTLAGLRRRGVTPKSINDFVRGIGITRRLDCVSAVAMDQTFKLTNMLCLKCFVDAKLPIMSCMAAIVV